MLWNFLFIFVNFMFDNFKSEGIYNVIGVWDGAIMGCL